MSYFYLLIIAVSISNVWSLRRRFPKVEKQKEGNQGLSYPIKTWAHHRGQLVLDFPLYRQSHRRASHGSVSIIELQKLSASSFYLPKPPSFVSNQKRTNHWVEWNQVAPNCGFFLKKRWKLDKFWDKGWRHIQMGRQKKQPIKKQAWKQINTVFSLHSSGINKFKNDTSK